MVIICDHVNGLKTVSSLLKGRGCGKTHVTLIQEMNEQWKVFVISGNSKLVVSAVYFLLLFELEILVACSAALM